MKHHKNVLLIFRVRIVSKAFDLSKWQVINKNFMAFLFLSKLCVIQQSYTVITHLGTKKVPLISNSVLSDYLLTSCHCAMLHH